jgi:hypothetical protein
MELLPSCCSSKLSRAVQPFLRSGEDQVPGQKRDARISTRTHQLLAYSGETFAVIREWVGHGSDAMIKHYLAKWQSNNANEMAKLQPVVQSFSRSHRESPKWRLQWH